MTYIKHWPKFITLAALILAGFGLQACGDDDSSASPSEDAGSVDSGTGGTGGNEGGSKGGTGGKKGGGGTGGDKVDNPDEDAGGGTSGGSPDSGASGDCSGADGCYSCEPKTNDQLLNHCTDATCQAYDNSKLSELLPGGKLPALP